MQLWPLNNVARRGRRGLRPTLRLKFSASVYAAVAICAAACLTVWCAALAVGGDEQTVQAEPKGVTSTLAIPRLNKGAKWSAKDLRAKYSFQSLSDRLAYERKLATGDNVRFAGVDSRLNEVAREALDAEESTIESQQRYDLRTRALVELHSNRVEQFISREGFGLARLPTPTPDNLQLPEAPPLAFASVSSDALRQEGVRALSIPATQKDRGDLPERLPTLSMLRQLHTGSRWNFFSISAWGLVKNKEHVAGFEGHAFRHRPELVEPRMSADDPRAAEPDPKHPWLVTRLELVSLLKHETPKVYLSEHLPKMAELASAKVRDLDEFEMHGLKTLDAGDELAAEATLNRIRMLGAVRASKQCLDCHEGQRGELLGAFSYELRRDPPVKPARKPSA
jgi:hypothetical protein